jgi:hypothetical protein
MSISYEIDHDRRRVTSRAVGAVSYPDMVSHVEAEAREQVLSYPELLDGRGATAMFTAIEARQFVALLERVARDCPLGPVAVVVSNDVSFGMARMLGILLEGVCAIIPFRDIEAAERWLGWRT